MLNHSRGLEFYENQIGNGIGKRFLNIRLVGKGKNTEAIGAKVYVSARVMSSESEQLMSRYSQANSNYNGQNTTDMHFGLGQASQANRLKVVWPNGEELECTNIAANQFLVIDQRQASAGICP